MSEDRYTALREKLDAKILELEARHRKFLQCRKACHSCCQPHLSVFPVEAEAIQNFLQSSPERAAIEALEQENPFASQRCSFLKADGSCSIYAVRPLICRSHGLPLSFRDEAERSQRDVCPLNFSDVNLDSLPGEGLLNLDLINALLTLINQDAFGEKAAQRVALRPSAILEAELQRAP